MLIFTCKGFVFGLFVHKIKHKQKTKTRVLEGWQIAADRLSRVNNTLQPAIILGSSVPESDGGGEDGLDDGGVEVLTSSTAAGSLHPKDT